MRVAGVTVSPAMLIIALLLFSSRKKTSGPAPQPTTSPAAAGNHLSLADLRALAASVGFPPSSLDVAAAVAMAESGGMAAAKNLTAHEQSYGLWQINVMAHPEYSPDKLVDATENARAALAISSGGTNWAPWSTFTTTDPNLSYRRFMPPESAAGEAEASAANGTNGMATAGPHQASHVAHRTARKPSPAATSRPRRQVRIHVGPQPPPDDEAAAAVDEQPAPPPKPKPQHMASRQTGTPRETRETPPEAPPGGGDDVAPEVEAELVDDD